MRTYETWRSERAKNEAWADLVNRSLPPYAKGGINQNEGPAMRAPVQSATPSHSDSVLRLRA